MSNAPSPSRRQFLRAATAAVIVCATACASPSEEASAQHANRCANCGMRVTRGAAFASGAREASGAEVVFDSPKCMFRWLEQHRDARDAWTTEHLSRQERPAAGLFYVLGTDLRGPMGADLVPVDTREHADTLLASHHGQRVLVFAEVTPEIVASLFRM